MLESESRNDQWAFNTGMLLFLMVFLKNAWVTDDAYIIFRSVEQLFAGNGPVWNPHERVQVFTSPLWFWTVSFARIFSTDVFVNAIGLSLILCVSTLVILRQIVGNFPFLLAVLLLISSNGFFDYSCSGLENPLGYFLITLFLLNFIRLTGSQFNANPSKQSLIKRCFILYGLIIFTRIDLGLLMFPPVIYIYNSQRRFLIQRQWYLLITRALTPLIGWSLFSLIYYGYVFPNTVYAKLQTGIDQYVSMQQGLKYFVVSLRHDPVIIVIVLLALILTVLSKIEHTGVIGYGIMLHLLFIVYVGGDYMMGRFMSYAFLASIILILECLKRWDSLFERFGSGVAIQKAKTISAGTVLLYLMLFPHTPALSSLSVKGYVKYLGITDIRRYNFKSSSLYQYILYRSKPDRAPWFPSDSREWSAQGYAFSKDEDNLIKIKSNIGFFGYHAGVDKIIVDPLGLGDSLLSRLPTGHPEKVRVGHYKRVIPAGYLDSIESGEPVIEDSQLNEYYIIIKTITQDKELFTINRLKTIFLMNTGYYDHLIEPMFTAGGRSNIQQPVTLTKKIRARANPEN